MNVETYTAILFLSLIAVTAMVLGSASFLTVKNLTERRLSFFLGLSAGAMLYISFIELIPESIKSTGYIPSNIFFFLGLLIMAGFDKIGPHFLHEFCRMRGIRENEFTVCSMFVAIAMSLHKLMEGAALAISLVANPKFGIILALAIIAHNFPEGIAYAAPLRAARLRRKKILLLSSISSSMTLIGSVVAVIFSAVLPFRIIEPYMYALIAGVMSYISFDELLPASFRHDEGHRALLGIIAGMALVAIGISIF